MEELTNGIEAILFAIGRNISVFEISDTLGMDVNEVGKAIEKLKEKYSNRGGISLVNVSGGYQLVSSKDYYEYVNKFISNSKKQTLSSTCMEVLSIIAYNPKITKNEIEKIRGANSDSQVSRLLEYGLVEKVGRLNLPGRPSIYSITDEFLKCMGISCVEELPEFENISSSDEELEEFKKE